MSAIIHKAKCPEERVWYRGPARSNPPKGSSVSGPKVVVKNRVYVEVYRQEQPK